MARPRSATLRDDLARAEAAVRRAVDQGADPWRVAELRLRHAELLDRALACGAHDPAPALARVPVARTQAEPFPLEWTDESGRARRGRGEPS